MESSGKTIVGVTVTVASTMEKVWECWTEPRHITQWYQTSPDWHAPSAENDLRENGKFKIHMAARDGSMAFDFEGIYTKVKKHEFIAYEMSDGRRAEISFEPKEGAVVLTENFEAENENPVDLQKAGWQAILESFRSYVESN